MFLPLTLMYSQVGINTTTPSTASVLDINSSSDGVNYGGLMPPRVTSIAQRNAINPGISDLGLLIFLIDSANNNYCLQMWNGSSWENVHCIGTPAVTEIAAQDFDLKQTWTYTNSPNFYSVGNDTWNIVSTLQNINGLDANFLGCRDLNNTNGGGPFLHNLVFSNVDISSYTSVQILFDFEIFEYDNGDDVFYELFYDDVSQGSVQFIDGSGNYTNNGTIVLNIPNTVTNVRMTLSVIQNGDDDMSGFDKLRILGL